MAAAHLEIERKYDVEPGTPLPSLTDLPGVAEVQPGGEHELEAVYFDTDDLALARAKVTLRRRTGGSDAGWHLKRPLGDDRQELREPLGRAVKTPPAPLRSAVQALVRGRALSPVATLTTRRTVHRLVGSDGTVLAEVSDDTVAARLAPDKGRGDEPGDQVTVESWREWEVELVDGPRDLVDAAGERMASTGARPAAGPSKLARALASRLDGAGRSTVEEPAEGTAGAVVLAHLREQVRELQERDPQVRQDLPDSVHKMRVATRRLRSALATFRPLLDRRVTDPLREELKWLGGVLGEARDAEVMRERLAAMVAAEPPELVLGGVARSIDAELKDAYDTAHARAVEALDSTRYFHLLDSLDALVDRPPWSELADRPADAVLLRRVRRTWQRWRGFAEAADAAEGEARDVRLHDVRKAAKRARYAGEALTPAFGGPARRFAAAAERVQEILGEHQDSVVTRDLLRRLAVQAHLSGENAFTYGRLHGLEQGRGERTGADYAAAWQDARAKKLRRWLKH